MPELAFIPNTAREGEGLSDAGIEIYRDNPFPAVARENGQNSRDAHDRERWPDAPVRVEIDRIEVPATSLPDHAGLELLFADVAAVRAWIRREE